MIHLELPENFDPAFEGVGCLIEHAGEILLLHRHDDDEMANVWGLPGGGKEEGENVLEAMRREIREETGIETEPERISHLVSHFVKQPPYDFVYHVCRLPLRERPEIVLSKEHKDFRWVKPQDALTMDLMPDLNECLRQVYGV